MSLSPTSIIVDAIKDKLEQFEETYKEIYITFELPDECTAVMVDMNDKTEVYPLDEKEISTLKNLFLNKIAKMYKSATKDNRKVNRIVLVIVLEPEELLKLFVNVKDSEKFFQFY